jgi:hypothetical protein
MKKIITQTFIGFLISIFLLPVYSSGQIKKYSTGKYRPSQVTVEVLFNYAQPIPHLYSDMASFFSFEGYGVKYGFGSEINIRLITNKKGTIMPYATLGYNLFMGNDGSTAYLDSNVLSTFPLPGNGTYSSVSGSSKMLLHNFNFGLGFSYAFANRTRWTPFLGADLDVNILFGTYRQTPNAVVGNNIADEVSYTINQGVRFGFGLGGGVHLRVSKYVGFLFEAKYKLTNLLGKDSKVSTELNKMYLNDLKDTDLNSNLVKSRQIDYLQFSLGVAFYIGRK